MDDSTTDLVAKLELLAEVSVRNDPDRKLENQLAWEAAQKIKELSPKPCNHTPSRWERKWVCDCGQVVK